jgi:hypothetical protein
VPDDYYGDEDGPRPFTQRNAPPQPTEANISFSGAETAAVGELNEPNFPIHLFGKIW